MRDEIPLGGNGKRPLQGEQQKGTKVQTICGEREEEAQCDGRGLRLRNHRTIMPQADHGKPQRHLRIVSSAGAQGPEKGLEPGGLRWEHASGGLV